LQGKVAAIAGEKLKTTGGTGKFVFCNAMKNNMLKNIPC
jgi:hypothetical protein